MSDTLGIAGGIKRVDDQMEEDFTDKDDAEGDSRDSISSDTDVQTPEVESTETGDMCMEWALLQTTNTVLFKIYLL